MGRYGEAITTAQQADPIYAAAWNSQAVSSWLSNEQGERAATDRQAQFLINQALALYAQPQPLQETFENTTYIEPLALRLRGQILAQFNQGRIFSSLGKQAEEVAEALRRQAAAEAEQQAEEAEALKFYQQAAAAYQEALDLQTGRKPKHLHTQPSRLAELWLNQGVAQYHSKEPTIAARSFKAAVDLDPSRLRAGTIGAWR